MKPKPPTKARIKDALYALAELGVARRDQPDLWARAQAEALQQHPEAPRRKSTGKPIWSTVEVRTAIARYKALGGTYSVPSDPTELLTRLVMMLPKGGILGTSNKTKKSEAFGVENRIVYLSPAWEAGFVMCPYHGICGRYCVGHSSGRQGGRVQRRNRLVKTVLWHLFPDFFLQKVQAEAWNLMVEATGKGRIPAIRMNGSSDVRWEQYGLFQSVPSVSWYDYTKIPLDKRGDRGRLPPNYHLTFSLDETQASWRCATKYLDAGHNVAIVVRADWHTSDKASKEAKEAILNRGFIGKYPVTDGDEHDARFKDVNGHWVVLYAKSLAAGDSEGFSYPVTREGLIHAPALRLPLANRKDLVGWTPEGDELVRRTGWYTDRIHPEGRRWRAVRTAGSSVTAVEGRTPAEAGRALDLAVQRLR